MVDGKARTSVAIEDEIHRLATLSPLEYESARTDAASRLGIRVNVLDRLIRAARNTQLSDALQGERLNLVNPQPWPDAVEGAAVLAELAETLGRFLVLPPHAEIAIALWTLHAHVLAVDRAVFEISPRLVFSSPAPRCGKTTGLSIVELTSPRALNAASVTPAAIFRAIEKARPTLIIDEADTLFRDGSEDLRGLLNAGHRAGCGVVRVVGDDHEPRNFDVFTPLAIAAIGKLPGTLEDRAIAIRMKRRAPGEKVERFRRREAGFLGEIQRRLSRWAADNASALAKAGPKIPTELDDRAADNWEPLLAIADAVGGSWPDRARKAALALSSARDAGDAGAVPVRLLSDIRSILAANGSDRIFSATLSDQLSAIEESPWSEWGRWGRPITPVQIARLLAGFGVRPKTIRIGDQTAKGYDLEALNDAFARYLPPSDPSHVTKPEAPEGIPPPGGIPATRGSECDGVTVQPPVGRRVAVNPNAPRGWM